MNLLAGPGGADLAEGIKSDGFYDRGPHVTLLR